MCMSDKRKLINTQTTIHSMATILTSMFFFILYTSSRSLVIAQFVPSIQWKMLCKTYSFIRLNVGHVRTRWDHARECHVLVHLRIVRLSNKDHRMINYYLDELQAIDIFAENDSTINHIVNCDSVFCLTFSSSNIFICQSFLNIRRRYFFWLFCFAFNQQTDKHILSHEHICLYR